MKKYFIFLLLTVACSKQATVAPIPKPITDFTWVESTNGNVQFTNTSKNADSYQWDFGDNIGKSTSANPSYKYDFKGDYPVKLVAKNASGEGEAINTVKISTGREPTPMADFSWIENKGQIQFTNLSKYADYYLWDFGDGTPKSIDKDPLHKYAANGTYTITLNLKGKGGETTHTHKIDVKAVPVPSKIYITKITVVKFPPNKPDGTPWDGCCNAIDARPDIYPTIQYGKSEIWSGESQYVKDANPNVIYSFNVNPISEIRFPEQSYGIYLYDKYGFFDGGYPMGGLTFIPNTDILKGYPVKAKISCTSCTIEYEIELKYEY